MAGQRKFIIRHPNGEDFETALKGGKVPAYATWAFYTEGHPHRTAGAGWVRLGWSYQTTLEDAQRKALPDFRKHGMKVTATRVLPAGF